MSTRKRNSDWDTYIPSKRRRRETRRNSRNYRGGAASYGSKSLRGIIGAPNGLYNSRFSSREEKKFLDVTGVQTGAGGAILTLLNGVTQQTDYNNRVGRKFSMKSFYVRFGAWETVAVNFVRFLVVYDLQTNGVAPAITDVLALTSVYSPNNLNNRDRFKTVMDKVVSVGIGTGPAYRVKYRKLNTETHNSGVTNAVASIATGALFMIVIPDGTSATTSIAWYSRIRFTDA